MIFIRLNAYFITYLLKVVLLIGSALFLSGCFGGSPEWELNLGDAGNPLKTNIITDHADDSYVVTQHALSKVNSNGELDWSLDSSAAIGIQDETVEFSNYLEESDSQLSLFLSSETTLYQITVDKSGNVLESTSISGPTNINLHHIHVVKHQDRSYGILTNPYGDQHAYLKLEDSGLSLIAEFDLESDFSDVLLFDHSKKPFISNGETDCYTNTSNALAHEFEDIDNSVKCFDVESGALIYEIESDTATASSFLLGDKLAFAAAGQLEIHDLTNKERIHTYPTGDTVRMLAANDRGIVFYDGPYFPTAHEETSIVMVSWQGEPIWSRSAKNTLPIQGAFVDGKLFVSRYNFADEAALNLNLVDGLYPDYPPDAFETIQIGASGNKMNTYYHEGGKKPVLEIGGKTTTHPALTTVSSNGKPRVLSFYYPLTQDLVNEARTSLVYIQQF